MHFLSAFSVLAVFGWDDALMLIYFGLTVASTAYTVSASQEAADAQEEAGRNQKLAAEQQARNIELTTAENLRRQRVERRRELARIRTRMNTSGLVFEGSSLEDAFVETAGIMELKLLDAARAGNMDAANARSAGDLALWESRVQALASRREGVGSLLSGVSSIAGVSIQSGAFSSQPSSAGSSSVNVSGTHTASQRPTAA